MEPGENSLQKESILNPGWALVFPPTLSLQATIGSMEDEAM